MSEALLPVFTIGHSTHSREDFLVLLRTHRVTALADVRSVPYSRLHPQFNRENLSRVLKEFRIKYAFLGRELGARSQDPACYDNGHVQYARLAATDVFRAGIQRVLTGARRYRVALMCSEKDPIDCHRTVLVARALADHRAKVAHIGADGGLETHEEVVHRMREKFGLDKPQLFLSSAELTDEAYRRQEARIAFVNRDMVDEER